MTQPIFAADRTFRRLREAGILAEIRTTNTLVIEVICGNWHIRVRGCAGAQQRRWFTVEVDWDEVQSASDNPLIDAVDRVCAQLADAARPVAVKAG